MKRCARLNIVFTRLCAQHKTCCCNSLNCSLTGRNYAFALLFSICFPCAVGGPDCDHLQGEWQKAMEISHSFYRQLSLALLHTGNRKQLTCELFKHECNIWKKSTGNIYMLYLIDVLVVTIPQASKTGMLLLLNFNDASSRDTKVENLTLKALVFYAQCFKIKSPSSL